MPILNACAHFKIENHGSRTWLTLNMRHLEGGHEFLWRQRSVIHKNKKYLTQKKADISHSQKQKVLQSESTNVKLLFMIGKDRKHCLILLKAYWLGSSNSKQLFLWNIIALKWSNIQENCTWKSSKIQQPIAGNCVQMCLLTHATDSDKITSLTYL